MSFHPGPALAGHLFRRLLWLMADGTMGNQTFVLVPETSRCQPGCVLARAHVSV